MTALVAQLNTFRWKSILSTRRMRGGPVGLMYLNRAVLSGALFLLSLAFAVIYVIEFNAILMAGETMQVVERELKKAESELARNTAEYSKFHSDIISRSFGVSTTESVLERVSKIDYIEKGQFADASRHMQ